MTGSIAMIVPKLLKRGYNMGYTKLRIRFYTIADYDKEEKGHSAMFLSLQKL